MAVLLTGYSWDQPQGSQHTEGSKGFNIKSTWLTPVAMHRRVDILSLNFYLLIFGQNLQYNTEESVSKNKKEESKNLVVLSVVNKYLPKTKETSSQSGWNFSQSHERNSSTHHIQVSAYNLWIERLEGVPRAYKHSLPLFIFHWVTVVRVVFRYSSVHVQTLSEIWAFGHVNIFSP